MSEGRRAWPKRLGVSALNLLLPGLGLQRLGERSAYLFLLAVPVLLLLTIAYYALVPRLDFTGYAVSSLLLLGVYLLAMLATMAMSWRRSREQSIARPWWSRWYSLVGTYLAISLVGFLLVEVAHGYYKPFYLPSEAMAPTLLPNDRLIASMGGPGELRRGDVILFDIGESVYIKRVAGLPGDRIELIDGLVHINDRAIASRRIGTERLPFESFPGPFGETATRLAEQFPGEAAPHQIYDMGPGPSDDFPAVTVPAGHVFVLGDNRDQSADSRISRAERGVEMLPLTQVRGHALFYTWGPSARMGEPIVAPR